MMSSKPAVLGAVLAAASMSLAVSKIASFSPFSLLIIGGLTFTPDLLVE
jgi:hypothetical protein